MGLLSAIFAGMRDSREKKAKQQEYENLLSTPYLHSSQFLNDLYLSADTKAQKEAIIEHINRFQAYEVESYMDIHEKYISGRWDK